MFLYLLRRILMMVPTLFGITIVSFIIINLAPGSPIEQRIQQMRFGEGASSGLTSGGNDSGIPSEVLEALKKQYGFDQPLHMRYWIWLKNLSTLNFGESFKYEEPVLTVIARCLPVSIQFGFWSLVLIYVICVPLGVAKAVKDGSVFDTVTSFILFVAYSVPPLTLGILLIVFFAGGSYFSWFPNHGAMSDNYADLTVWQQMKDRTHHFTLPLICYMVNSFTITTLLMKNSLLDEIKLDYVRTARAKGLSERAVIMKHALRNALIPIATGVGSFLGLFLAGSLVIESVFSLNGIGLLAYTAALSRDTMC